MRVPNSIEMKEKKVVVIAQQTRAIAATTESNEINKCCFLVSRKKYFKFQKSAHDETKISDRCGQHVDSVLSTS